MTTTRPPLAMRAIKYETAMWRSLYRWITRRPIEGEAYPYTGPVMTILWAFIGVSAVELPILHLILPWPTVRLIADILGVYGLIWMIGLMASLKVNPHVVTGESIRIRNGLSLDLTLHRADVAGARARNRTLEPGKGIRIETEGDRRILYLAVAHNTSVDLVLRYPMAVELPKGLSEPVDEIRIYADDPKAMAARIQRLVA